MKKEGLFKRSITLLIGLFIMAFGVSLSVKANLGISPISCVPYVYSLNFPLTMGVTTIIFNVMLIIGQIILLRKNYELSQLLQIPLVIAFGFFIDYTLSLLSGLNASNYFMQMLLCLLSCIIIAFGVFLEVKAKLTYMAGEGLALAIAKTFKKDFGKSKVGVDSSLVAIGVISSFMLLHSLQGIREGTILGALLVGTIVRFFNRNLPFVDAMLTGKKDGTEEAIATTSPATSHQPHVAITIAREYGSGGHEIGEIVARKLGYSFYDNNLIDLSASASGLTPEYVKAHEQKLTNSLLFDLYEQNFTYVNEQMPPLDTLFMVQSKVIRDISEKESCVIVGRCADFVLKGHPNCINIFVHASKTFRKKRVVAEYGIEPAFAEKELELKDRDRKNYCKHYTHRVWGESTNYHLTVDSSAFGIQQSAQLIIDAVEKQTINK